jgi:ADP-heptose:LPS heptosyltransferase
MFSFLKNQVWSWWQNRPWRWSLLWVFPIATVARIFERKSPASVGSILVVHFGAIGDALMVTPAIRLLSESFPAAEIDVLTASKSALDVYSRNKRIHQVSFLVQYDRGDIKERFGSPHSLWRDRFRLFALYPTLVIRLLRKRYDAGIALGPIHQGATFSNLLFDLAGIPIRVGALGAHTDRLTHAKDPSISSFHWVDIYREIVSALTGATSAPDDTLEFEITDDERGSVNEFFKGAGVTAARPLAVIHAGGNLYVNSKRWAPDRFAAVGDVLAKRFDIILTGSGDERNLTDQIQQQMKSPAISTAGDFTFGETAALLDYASLVLTNDTSILHLADAVGVPQIVSIFGPTDAKKIVPRNSRNRYVTADIECAPCIDFDAGDPSRRCWRSVKEECLSRISVSDVLSALRAFTADSDSTISAGEFERSRTQRRAAVGSA